MHVPGPREKSFQTLIGKQHPVLQPKNLALSSALKSLGLLLSPSNLSCSKHFATWLLGLVKALAPCKVATLANKSALTVEVSTKPLSCTLTSQRQSTMLLFTDLEGDLETLGTLEVKLAFVDTVQPVQKLLLLLLGFQICMHKARQWNMSAVN